MTVSVGSDKKVNLNVHGQEVQTEWYVTGRNNYEMPAEINNNLFIVII